MPLKSTKKRRQSSRERMSTPLPYTAQPRLVTASELRFLHTGLQPALRDRYYIGVQIPMTTVLKVPDDQWDKAAGRRIRQKRFDFVLASPKTFRIKAVIELDDLSHRLRHRQKRDRFVEQACEAAGVLLIRIPVYRKYDPKLIRRIINGALREHRESRKVRS